MQKAKINLGTETVSWTSNHGEIASGIEGSEKKWVYASNNLKKIRLRIVVIESWCLDILNDSKHWEKDIRKHENVIFLI